jgi:hypothetical protein
MPAGEDWGKSTHPQGCDTSTVKYGKKEKCFNPRTHKECDIFFISYINIVSFTIVVIELGREGI